jgi:hypothetical protein
MSLDHNEFLQLSRIADLTRRSDPELARKLAEPMRRRRGWVKASHGTTLALCAILLLAGLVTDDLALSAAGGLALLTLYPLLLVVLKKRREGRRNARSDEN